MYEKSLPGNWEPANVPSDARRCWSLAVLPGVPQWPALTKPPYTAKPTEQRPAKLIQYGQPPTTSA